MEPSRRLARRSTLAALVLLVSLTASACGGSRGPGGSTIATVGTHAITQDDLQRQIASDKQVTRAVSKLQGQSKAAATAAVRQQFAGAGADTLKMSASTTALTALVRAELYREAMREDHVEVTAAQQGAAKDQITKSYQDQGVAVKDLPTSFVEQQIELSAMQAALATKVEVSAAALRKAYEAQAPDQTQTCVSIINVGDEATARTAYQRVTTGKEDFGAVSAELSTDATLKQQKGVAGCATAAQIAQSLGQGVYTAALNVPQPPNQVNGGWAVLLVTSRVKPTLTQLKPTLLPSLQSAGVGPKLRKVLDRVQINSRFGTWDAATASVVAPQVPVVPTTPSKKTTSTSTTSAPVSTGS